METIEITAVIFDLDGVIADTSEYHYLSWQRLADEEGLPFDRQVNERLRGKSRRASLDIILGGHTVDDEQAAAWLERKNDYFMQIFRDHATECLLPGVVPLIQELRQAGIKVGVGSASRNARWILQQLGIAELLDAIIDGLDVEHSKPAPDVFLRVADQMGVAAAHCVVLEDAAAGIEAALAAGMWVIGLGPGQRVGHAHARFDSLEGVTPAAIIAALAGASRRTPTPNPPRRNACRQMGVLTMRIVRARIGSNCED